MTILKTQIFLLLLSIIPSFSNYAQISYFDEWIQKGDSIVSLSDNDLFGYSLSLSGDGNTLISGTLSYPGYAKVYFYNGNSWSQKGSTLYAENSTPFNDLFGCSVDISFDGNTIAVGAMLNDGSFFNAGHVRIYSWNGTSWIQKGTDIDGEASGDQSGKTISLSSDGNTIAIGSINNNGNGTQSGHVRLYSWNGISWIQKGSDINGEAAEDHSGYSISVSSNGNVIAIGAPENDGNGINAGHVRIFEWNNTSWIQKGVDINGSITNSLCGRSVSLSDNGNVISVGANNSDGIASGQIRVFEWNGSTWIQKGTEILGEQPGDQMEIASLNSDGTILVTASPYSDGSGNDIGQVKIFEWNGTTWYQIGGAIEGLMSDDQFGYSLSIDALGESILTSAPFYDNGGFDRGKVNAYKLCNNVLVIDSHIECESFTWIDGTTYTQNNDSSIVFYQASSGCDSIVKLNLTILNNTAGNESIYACDSYTWIDGNTYFSNNNTATYLLTNSAGCDSIVTLNLTITSNTTMIYDTICGGSYIWNNQSYSTSGTYLQTFQAANGCDSIVTLNLIINPTNFNPSFTSSQQLFTSPPFALQFTNTTSNSSNYSFNWYWGDGTSSATNNSTVFHEYLNNGLYSVTLEATNMQTGCSNQLTIPDYIFTTGGTACTHLSTINQVGPINECSGQNVILSCNPSPTFTYQWRKNGVYILGNNNDSLNVTEPGVYSVIISENGCPVSSNEVIVNFSSITAPIISSSGSIQPCIGGSINLSTNSGYSSYLWSNGATTQATTINTSGNYTVQVTNSNGCSIISNPFIVNASILPVQTICVVGVDSVSNNLRVVWEKPITNAIDSFYIYKETNVSDIYSKVGARLYDSLSVWTDQTSNPAVQAYRYKITALDTCGTETPFSSFHKSIHLTINQGVGGAWNLIWSHYEGIVFGSYNIYRGTTLNNMSLINTIQSTLNSYTDLTAPAGNVYYQIEIINPNNCDPTKAINYSSSLSNIVSNNLNSISESGIGNFSIFPNPFNDILTIESLFNTTDCYTLFDPQGRKVLSGTLTGTTTQLDLSKLARGNYLLQIGEKLTPVKLVKE